MRYRQYLFILVAVLFVASCNKSQVTTDDYKHVSVLFNKPTAEYTSAPLWVWNDQVTKEEIKSQLDDFHSKGIDQVFVHPRPGLVTEYLSAEWLDLFKYAVTVGKQNGMKIWIYDENSYPSGFAGGHVPAEMPESKGRMIKMSQMEILPVDFKKPIIAVFESGKTGMKDVTADSASLRSRKGSYLVFYLVEPAPNPWFAGYYYVDVMQKKVTEKFLDVTLNAYKKVAGDEFGKTVPGSFQDECDDRGPGFGPRFRRGLRPLLRLSVCNLPLHRGKAGGFRGCRSGRLSRLFRRFASRAGGPITSIPHLQPAAYRSPRSGPRSERPALRAYPIFLPRRRWRRLLLAPDDRARRWRCAGLRSGRGACRRGRRATQCPGRGLGNRPGFSAHSGHGSWRGEAAPRPRWRGKRPAGCVCCGASSIADMRALCERHPSQPAEQVTQVSQTARMADQQPEAGPARRFGAAACAPLCELPGGVQRCNRTLSWRASNSACVISWPVDGASSGTPGSTRPCPAGTASKVCGW